MKNRNNTKDKRKKAAADDDDEWDAAAADNDVQDDDDDVTSVVSEKEMSTASRGTAAPIWIAATRQAKAAGCAAPRGWCAMATDPPVKIRATPKHQLAPSGATAGSPGARCQRTQPRSRCRPGTPTAWEDGQ